MQTPTEFFKSHAGYSYGHGETPEQGRDRCAKSLAFAEAVAHESGCTFHWEVDPHSDSSDWSDEEPAWQVWNCVMYNADGEVLASLSAIDFGRDGDPWGDPYRRVVEAELADEAFSA